MKFKGVHRGTKVEAIALLIKKDEYTVDQLVEKLCEMTGCSLKSGRTSVLEAVGLLSHLGMLEESDGTISLKPVVFTGIRLFSNLQSNLGAAPRLGCELPESSGSLNL